MFERNESVHEMVEDLFRIAKRMDRGDTLANDAIVAVLGVAPNQGHWKRCVHLFKRRVQDELGITLWANPGVGFYFMTVEEQITVAPRRRQRYAGRQLERGIKHLDAVPQEELSEHLKNHRAFVRLQMATLKSRNRGDMIRQGIFEQREALAPVPFRR